MRATYEGFAVPSSAGRWFGPSPDRGISRKTESFDRPTIFGWGIGLVSHAWNNYFRSPITDDAIEREIDRS